MHARDDGECSEFIPVKMISQMTDVSVWMKRGAEKPGNKSREIVTTLMSLGLGLVLVICKVAEIEKHMMEVKRRTNG